MCIGEIKVCFHCGEQFKEAEECSTCGWLNCPHCGKCFCNLNEGEQRVAEAMESQMKLNFA